MNNLNPKNAPDDGIIILSDATGLCGGTDATQDTGAPKSIASTDMRLFNVTSELPFDSARTRDRTITPLAYISAFAAPAGDGTFLFLETAASPRHEDTKRAWALVKENLFPALTDLVRTYDLARRNGFHSKTHGLPQDFGGRVDICYASGERIAFSNNQTPIMTLKEGLAIYELFGLAMRGEQIPLPDTKKLQSIHFTENRENGGYTDAVLSLTADGGILRKVKKYDTPDVYKTEATVATETVNLIKKRVKDCGILAWSNLPSAEYKFGAKKTLTFVFADGKEITTTDNKKLPRQIDRDFFEIELELTK